MKIILLRLVFVKALMVFSYIASRLYVPVIKAIE